MADKYRRSIDGLPRTEHSSHIPHIYGSSDARTVWEPPNIDVVGLFDMEAEFKWMEGLKKTIANPTLRTEYFDL